MAEILQTTLPNAFFLNADIGIVFQISLNFLRSTDLMSVSFQVMAWRRIGDKVLDKPMRPDSLMNIYVSRPSSHKLWIRNVCNITVDILAHTSYQKKHASVKNALLDWVWHVISYPSSAVYMRPWSRSALVQVMACRLFDAKKLPE